MDLIKERLNFRFTITNTYFFNISTNSVGGAFFINNLQLSVFISGCIFANCSSYGIYSTSFRPNAGGGGFASFSLEAEINKNCFINCFSQNVGPSFYSYVSINKHQLNSTSVIYCSSNLNNGIAMDYGIQIFNEINLTSNFLKNGLVFYSLHNFSFIFKFGNIFLNSVTQNYCLFGSNSINNIISSIHENINIINNTAEKGLIHLHNNNNQNIFKLCNFFYNSVPIVYFGTGLKIQFIECFGNSLMNSLSLASYSLCQFNDIYQINELNLDFCNNDFQTYTNYLNQKRNYLLILLNIFFDYKFFFF